MLPLPLPPDPLLPPWWDHLPVLLATVGVSSVQRSTLLLGTLKNISLKTQIKINNHESALFKKKTDVLFLIKSAEKFQIS